MSRPLRPFRVTRVTNPERTREAGLTKIVPPASGKGLHNRKQLILSYLTLWHAN